MADLTLSKARFSSINGGYSVLVRGRSAVQSCAAAPYFKGVYEVLGTCAFVPVAYSKETSI